MVTANQSLPRAADASTSRAATVRSTSAIATGAANPSAGPGLAPPNTFGSVLDRLGQADVTATTDATATIPASMPSSSNQDMVSATPDRQMPAPPLPAQTTPSPAGSASAAKPSAVKIVASAATTETTDDDDDPVASPPLAAALIPIPPPVPLPPAPPTGTSASIPLQAGDPTPATVPTTAAAPSEINGSTQLTADPTEKPTAALVAVQSAITPSITRPSGRIADGDPAKPTTNPFSKLVTQDAESASDDQPQATPPATGLALGIPVASPTVLPQAAQAAITAPAASAQLMAGRPGLTAAAASARAARPAAETDATTLPSPPVPDVSSVVNPPVSTIVATTTLGLSGNPASVSAAPAPRSVQQTPVPSSPAAQVAQAFIEPVKVLMSSPTHAASAVSHVTTIQITPVELGRVDIRIERSADGPARIELVAERPDTLSRLVHDRSQLQQALDQAGVPQAGRTIDFSLAPPPSPDVATSSSWAGSADNGRSNNGNEQQRQGGTYASQAFGTANETALAATTNFRSIRSGIDITA